MEPSRPWIEIELPVEGRRMTDLSEAANGIWRDRSIEGSEADSSTRRRDKVARLPALSASRDTDEPEENLQPAIWFEAEDFLRYFDHFPNPTGTQRLSFEIFRAANALYGASERVRFCRLSVITKRLHAIRFEDLRSAFVNPLGASAPWKTFWEPAIFWERFPRSILVVLQNPGFFLSILKFVARDLLEMLTGRTSSDRGLRRGDTIVSLGAGWGIPGYVKHMAETKRRYGIKFALFLHDVLPMEFPSFFEPRHAIDFERWLREVIPVADTVLTNSKYTRARLIELTAKSGWRLPRIEVLEPGSGFSDRLPVRGQATASLPARYVLFVSTIEIRKNHRLLVKVWERLVERYGADRVPALVFVGMWGWSFDELLGDLAANNYLNGKIVILQNLSDAALQEAYRRCLFTVFPSFCEGWGLPIAESLAHGKLCIASNRTSIPEVGGNLVDYFNPGDEEDALAKIERPLLDPAYLATREAQVRAEYRRRTWNDCVHALMEAFACSSEDRTADRTVDADRCEDAWSASDVSCA
jgi:glycosyltransferase involved in cell wall biosynthesis